MPDSMNEVSSRLDTLDAPRLEPLHAIQLKLADADFITREFGLPEIIGAMKAITEQIRKCPAKPVIMDSGIGRSPEIDVNRQAVISPDSQRRPPN